jgi:hypothetical protein
VSSVPIADELHTLLSTIQNIVRSSCTIFFVPFNQTRILIRVSNIHFNENTPGGGGGGGGGRVDTFGQTGRHDNGLTHLQTPVKPKDT